MKIYVDELPQTKGISRLEDDVTLTEVRMWFKTNEDVEIVSLAEHDKQVGNKIIELARKRNNDQFYIMTTEILDQIQGETQ